MNNLLEKLKEALLSVLPIFVAVLAMHFFIEPMPSALVWQFIIGSVFFVAGMSLFTLGADTALIPMGENIGSKLSQSKKLWLILAVCAFIGVVITLAEPDLHVLASQLESVGNFTFVLIVALGVGIYFMLAMLRVFFKIPLRLMFAISYGLIMILALIVQQVFVPVAFDASGANTGPITVPFLLALGIGVSAVRGDKSSRDDSFGLVGLCSVGPIFAVLAMSFFSTLQPQQSQTVSLPANLGEVFGSFFVQFPDSVTNVVLALMPVVLFYAVFSAIAIRKNRRQNIRIAAGVVYTFVGLVIFFVGVYVGFMPVGQFLGGAIGARPDSWILLPIGLVIGFFIVTAEPAVHILNKQVETITDGMISRRAMMTFLSIGVSVSLMLAMARVLWHIPLLYVLIPVYIAAIALSFFVPPIFTAIAFDSGGIASGTMAAAFLLPFAVGASMELGGNVLLDAFGLLAVVAALPIVTIQLLGLIYKIKLARQDAKLARAERMLPGQSEDIIEF